MTARACLLVIAGLLVPVAAGAAPPAENLPLVPPKTVPLHGAVPPVGTKPVARPHDPQAHLDRLYSRLAKAGSAAQAEGIAAVITTLRLRAGGATAELLASRALDAMSRKDTAAALRLFDAVVAVAPAYAEGWNERAMIYFRKGEYGNAMRDLHEVLRHEPRHWGAWEALGRILQQTGEDKAALAAYRRALAIDPQLPGLKTRVEDLAISVNGRRL